MKQTFRECIGGGSIVRREDDESVAINLEFTQFVENLPNTSVQLHYGITVPASTAPLSVYV